MEFKGKKGEIVFSKVLLFVLGAAVLLLAAFNMDIVKSLADRLAVNADSAVGEVKSAIGIGSGNSKCFNTDLEKGIVGGGFILKELGFEGENVSLRRCNHDAKCTLVYNSGNLEVELYRVFDMRFERLDGEVWKDVDSLFIGNLPDIRRNRNFYDAGLDVMKDFDFDFLKKGKDTQRFVFYGEGGILDTEIFIVWQNNKWVIFRGARGDNERVGVDMDTGILIDSYGRRVQDIEGEDVLEYFYSEVDDSFRDKVYWKVLEEGEDYDSVVDSGNEIGSFIGRPDEEYLDKEGFDVLKAKFDREKSRLLSKANPSDEDIDVLSNALDGEIVFIEDKKYDIKIEKIDGSFVLGFISDSEEFGLKYYPHGKSLLYFVFGYDRIDLGRHVFVLVEKEGDVWGTIGEEGYYKLPENIFEEVFDATILGRFLEPLC